MIDLTENFEAELWNTVHAAKAIGYYPTEFAAMLERHGGVTTAKRLIISGDTQSGFKRLSKLGRLDISMESKMLMPEYRSLFTPDELQSAEWRLSTLANSS